MASVGRPSGFGEAIAGEICSRIADGQSLREICRDEAMPAQSTVYLWLAQHEEFSERYARAREAQADRFGEEILEIADDARNDWMTRQANGQEITVADQENIQRSRVRIDARKWLMSKMAPKKYGDKVSVEHSGTVRHAAELPDDELAGIAASGRDRVTAQANGSAKPH